ncbi:T9SS type A sorting domain-containing protein [Catalinimonas alkaloidigena]|uniref:T9SS type A sorting domain-containing protein n=1 Tax=Catalinimonas alkaloidigena TaxID=1075417 RepID=UPI000B7DBBD8|nr:T9SS type A sorting domain-containing protein [Catalinimonas alkaloidigena]
MTIALGGNLVVGTGSVVEVGAFDATHTLTLTGNLQNSGTVDLYRSVTQVANITVQGTSSISGNTPQFNNITFQSGTVTANTNLDVEGTVVIEAGATFADGGYTHTVKNWTENGSGQRTGVGTIVMDASVSIISGTSTFHNLTFNGVVAGQFAGTTTVTGNFLATNNATVSSGVSTYFQGNFTVDSGSKFQGTTNGIAYFDAAVAQTLTFNGTVTFDQVRFQNGGTANPKTVVGNLIANDLTYVYSGATVTGNGAHQLEEMRIEGDCNLTGTLTLVGNQLWDGIDSDFTLLTELIVAGNVNIRAGNTLRVRENVTIESNYLVINDGAFLIQETAGRTLTLRTGTSLYARGTDNFPTGFTTFTPEYDSWVRYDANMPQTVRGGLTYANLYTRYDTKTVDGAIDVNGRMYLYTGVTLNLGSYAHTFEGNIENAGSNNSIVSTGTVTLDATDANQYIGDHGSGTYTFQNLAFTLASPTAMRTKTLYGTNYTVNGNFSATSGGDASSYLRLDLNSVTLTNDGGDQFALGDKVEVLTDGTSTFTNSVGSFSTTSLHVNSTVWFNGTNQTLPGITFGNLYLSGNGNKTAAGNLDINGDLIRQGGNAIFENATYNVNVAGDMSLGAGYMNATGSSSTFTFDGTDQAISSGTFYNITFSTGGNKTVSGTTNVLGNMSVNAGSVYFNNSNIVLEGHLLTLSGNMYQTTGTTTLTGGNYQFIGMGSSSILGDLTIDKSAGQVAAATNITIERDFIMTANRAVFSLNSFFLRVGRHFVYNSGCTFNANSGTLHLNGSVLQNINVNTSGLVLNHLRFSGTGEKRLNNNDVDINGNVIIDGALFNAQNRNLTVAGNWTNTGTFQSTARVTFDRAGNQTISASTFHDLYIDGSGTKTLTGSISMDGRMEIDNGTLDVSASNYNIIVEEHWYNTGAGSFTPRQGTVTFVGNSSRLYTGGTGAGKTFNRVVVNLSSGQYMDLYGDLLTAGDLRVSRGNFRTYGYDMYIGGSLINDDTFQANSAAHDLFLNATSGARTFKPGSGSYRDITINASGASYKLTGNLDLYGGYNLVLDAGTFALGGYTVTMPGTGGNVTVNAGTFSIDSASTLQVGNGGTVTNAGGTFRIVGVDGDYATMKAYSGTYTFVQTSGTFHARYFNIQNTRGNGINLQGGSLDATNCFADGIFTGGTNNAYATLTGIDLGSGVFAGGTSFGAGPTYNITRLSGTGVITFQNADGIKAGAAYEQDGGNLIAWEFPDGYFWDNDNGDNNWNNALNWSGNTLPDLTSNVYLEHTYVTGAYTVNVNANAEANRLVLDAQSGSAIALTLNGANMTVDRSVLINTNTTVTQTQATDTIRVGGSWTNAGTFNEGNAVVVFEGHSGSGTIATKGTSDPFYHLIINAPSATYTLESILDIDGNMTLTAGTLDVGGANYAIYAAGNWTAQGGTLNGRAGTVTLNKAGTSSQTVTGGSFNHLSFTNPAGTGTATKVIASGLSVLGNLTIDTNTGVQGGSNLIRVGGHWRNNVGASGFSAGSSAVVFDGSNQTIGNGGQPTTFNNVYFQGSGNKSLALNMNVGSNFQITSVTVTVEDGVTVNGTGANNNLQMASGLLRIMGLNGFPQNFENPFLSGGRVEYRGNINQNVYPTAYYDLYLLRNNAGNVQTKTLSGPITVANNLVVNDAETTLNANGQTITLGSGLYLATGGPQVTWSGGTLVHNGGSWNLDSDITSFHHLVLSGSGTKRLYNNLTISGNVSVQNDITLRMDDYTMTASGSGQTFSMLSSSYLTVSIPTSTGVAFPTNFATYALDPTSRVTLNGATNQTIYTVPNYGELYLSNSGNATLGGNLDVEGDMVMTTDNTTLVDAGYNMNLAGSLNDFRNYPAPGGTVTFDGADQAIRSTISLSVDPLNFNQLIFAGTGTKTFGNGEDVIDISGNMTVQSGITVTSSLPIFFSGAQWQNLGTFTHSGSTVTFDAATAQVINPGVNHTFNAMTFQNGSKTIVLNGLDVNGDFTIASGAHVNMSALTHRVASGLVTVAGSWTTSTTNFFFDGGNQTLPAFTALDVTIQNGGTKTMSGAWSADDLTIASGARLDVSTSNYGVTLTGYFDNQGTFTSRNGTVAFESANTSAKVINIGGSNFYNVTFNQSQTNSRTYTLQTNTNIYENLIIGNGATLKLNGKQLNLGDNTAGETYTIQSGGTLDVDAGAKLRFDTRGGNDLMTVAGTLRVVGTSGNSAEVERIYGSNYYGIVVNSGATIHARYYHFHHLDDNGLRVQNGATIDPTNNFSDGAWSDMRTGGSGARYYLQVEASSAGLPDISNVTFNYGATPSIGRDYNVRRTNAATGNITFAGTISGILAGATYEDDGSTKIIWPSVSTVTWTGSQSTDWHNPNNWSPATVPTSTIDAFIPLGSPNNPLISTGDAVCRNMTITNGVVELTAGRQLNVVGDMVIGTGASSAILAVLAPSSGITVGGNWTRAANASFIHGNGTVTFTGAINNFTLTPRTSAFYNLVFNGSGTFTLSGSQINVEGNMTLFGGTIDQATNNYVISLSGNYTNSGGTFLTATTGTMTFVGTNQVVTNGTFNRVSLAGNGVKTTSGTLTVSNTFDIAAGDTLQAGGPVNLSGNATIAANGAILDGGQTISFNGAAWTNAGYYEGTGTVNFDRAGNQTIAGGMFNNLTLSGTGQVSLLSNMAVTGNVTVYNSINTLRLETYLIQNTDGSGTFYLDANESMYVLGNDNFPAGFSTYDLHDNSWVRYEGTIAQQIAPVRYGELVLNNATTKTLKGDIIIDSRLYVNDATLDASTNSYKITIYNHWVNNGTGTFVARAGEVVFAGGLSSQYFYTNTSGSNDFYRLTVNKTAGTQVYPADNDTIVVKQDLQVQSGIMNANNRVINVQGDLNVTSGDVATNGTYYFNKASGSATLRTNNAVFNTMEFAGGATYTVQDALTLNGSYTLGAGVTFDGNGKAVTLGDNIYDQIVINGDFRVGAGGTLYLGNDVTLTVNSGGTFRAVGTGSQPVTVTSRNTTNYNFTVFGTIHAQYYTFEKMASNGIYVAAGATIDPTNNFSNGTFTNGQNGGTLLRVHNNQILTGSNRIENVVFPSNPGGGAYNVSKGVNSGQIEFYSAAGAFAGAGYENDPYDLIEWTGITTITWTGATNSEWALASNWSTNTIPTSGDDVIITSGPVNQPVISGTPALARTIDLQSGAFLRVNSASSDADLTVASDLTFAGNLQLMSADDSIVVRGNFTESGGSFNNGGGIVTVAPVSGSATITTGSPFYKLTIAGSGTVLAGNALTISNDLTIKSGAIFDVSAQNYQLSIAGNYTNQGSFVSRSGTLLMNATGGTRTIRSGGSSLYRLTVMSSATYQLLDAVTVSNRLEHNTGTFRLNGNTLSVSGQLNVHSGTFAVGALGTLRMGNNAAINVNSGATFSMVGNSASQLATVTSTGTTRYAFNINSGATLAARYYSVNYINSTGLRVYSGATIDGTNNLSYGTFSNGATSGRYLWLENNFADFVATEVTFNAGASYNVRRVSGTGVITFFDAAGVLSGYLYEQDDNYPNSGRIRWTSTVATVVWNGLGGDNNWHNPANWDIGTVPTITHNVVIPSSHLVNVYQQNAFANNVQIASATTLTFQSGWGLSVEESIENAGTITINAGSNSILSMGETWTNTGTFNYTNAGTIQLTAATGDFLITNGANPLYNMTINSAAPGTATYTLVDSLVLAGNLTVTDGTLATDGNKMHVRGNWTIATNGEFAHGDGVVEFDGPGAQAITFSGLGSFYDVEFDSTGAKTLGSNLTVLRDLTIHPTSSLNASSYTLSVAGNWDNTGAFTPGTSTVVLNGATPQAVSRFGGESFNNLQINNTAGTGPQILLGSAIAVSGTMTFTDGIVQSSAANMVSFGAAATVASATEGSYISGPARKAGSSDFTFPVGNDTLFAPIGISGLTGSSTFTAEYFDDPYDPNGPRETTLKATSQTEYWDLTRNSGSAAAYVTLHWRDGAHSTIESMQALVVAHHSGTQWEDFGGTTSGSVAQGSVTSTSRLTSFSPITFGSTNWYLNPLPVELVAFGAAWEKGTHNAVVSWKTVSETNNAGFELERSLNGDDWTVITFVEGHGTTNLPQQYGHVDVDVQGAPVYYRLRQIDLDGAVHLSDVVVLEAPTPTGLWLVQTYPNPFRDAFQVKVQTEERGTLKMQLLNLYGTVLHVWEAPVKAGQNQVEVDQLAHLPAGIYLLTVEQNGRKQTLRMIKQ